MNRLALRTLYEDWSRQYQGYLSQAAASQVAAAKARLFAYLLERYRGESKVQQEYRSLRDETTGRLNANDRAIVVHHHIHDQGAGVSSIDEAAARVTSVLERMQRHRDLSEDFEEPLDEPSAAPPTASAKEWEAIVSQIRRGRRPDRRMARSLKRTPYLPAAALMHLAERIQGTPFDDRALQLLLQCRNASTSNLLARAWRQFVVEASEPDARRFIEDYFQEEGQATEKRRSLALLLSDNKRTVRLSGLKLLQRVGSLDEIPMLLDLAVLEEEPEEQTQLHATIQAIAARE